MPGSGSLIRDLPTPLVIVATGNGRREGKRIPSATYFAEKPRQLRSSGRRLRLQHLRSPALRLISAQQRYRTGRPDRDRKTASAPSARARRDRGLGVF